MKVFFVSLFLFNRQEFSALEATLIARKGLNLSALQSFGERTSVMSDVELPPLGSSLCGSLTVLQTTNVICLSFRETS